MTAETNTSPRRRRRAEAEDAAVVQAATDGAMRKGNEKDATSNVPEPPKAKAAPAPTKAARRAAAKTTAAEQAERDALRKADVTPLSTMPTGRPLTLHEQNLIARARDKEMRNDAREASRAAGKAAYDVLVHRVGPDAIKARRFRAMGSAEKLMLDAQRRAAEQAKQG